MSSIVEPTWREAPLSEGALAMGAVSTPDGPRVCGIADALDLVGERWTLLVLREVTLGVRRFSDIRANTGAPRETLSARLKKLETAGLLVRRSYSERPPREEYVLTEAGEALAPILRALKLWGETYARPVMTA